MDQRSQIRRRGPVVLEFAVGAGQFVVESLGITIAISLSIRLKLKRTKFDVQEANSLCKTVAKEGESIQRHMGNFRRRYFPSRK